MNRPQLTPLDIGIPVPQAMANALTPHAEYNVQAQMRYQDPSSLRIMAATKSGTTFYGKPDTQEEDPN